MNEAIKLAVIAAAGQGTRMWPASKVVPKELFPIGKLPVITHVVAEMIDAGLNQVVVVSAAHNSGFMKDLFDPSKRRRSRSLATRSLPAFRKRSAIAR